MKKSLFAMSAIITLFAMSPFAHASEGRQVLVKDIKGDVFVQRAGSTDWPELSQSSGLKETDSIKTGFDSAVEFLIKGSSDALITLQPQSILKLAEMKSSQDNHDETLLDLSMGRVLVKADKLQGESEFEVKTPNSIVGIRGTEFEVSVE